MIAACSEDSNGDKEVQDGLNLKQEMRDFVIGISEYCKDNSSSFFIIPQNGIELVTSTGDEDGEPDINYLNAIDGNGQEDLFYAYEYYE